MLVGLLVFAGAVVDANAASLVTGLVTTALAHEPRLEVVSSADLRRQLDLEASRQAAGCDVDSSTCLADVAGAMGARLVVSGQLGSLGDVVILTLNLFDSNAGAAVGRVSVKEPSLEAVGDRVDEAVAELVAPFLQSAGSGKTRVLVLDVEPPVAAAAAAAPASSSSFPLAGVIGVSAGALVAVVSGVLVIVAAGKDGEADNDAVDAVTADRLYGERDLYGGLGLAGLGVGAVLAGAGGVAWAVAE